METYGMIRVVVSIFLKITLAKQVKLTTLVEVVNWNTFISHKGPCIKCCLYELNFFLYSRKRGKKKIRIFIPVEFPWENPSDSSQDEATLNCTCDVSVFFQILLKSSQQAWKTLLKYCEVYMVPRGDCCRAIPY